MYPYWWGGFQYRIFCVSSGARSGGEMLFWRPWEFLVKLVENCCQCRYIFLSYVAMFFQNQTSNFLEKFKAGGFILIIEVEAWAWLVKAQHCGYALTRDPTCWWLLHGGRRQRQRQKARAELRAYCWGRFCVGRRTYDLLWTVVWRLKLQGIYAWYICWRLGRWGWEGCSWQARGRPLVTSYSRRGSGHDPGLQ